MERITPAEIERVYGNVADCLKSYADLRRVGHRLKDGMWDNAADARVDPDPKELQDFRDDLSDLRGQCTVALAALKPVQPFLHLHTGEAVTLGRSTEPTLAEVVVVHLPVHVRIYDGDFDGDWQQTRWMFDRVLSDDGFPLAAIQAELKIEKAQMEEAAREALGHDLPQRDGYWYFEGERIRFQGKLTGLVKQPARMLRILIRAGSDVATFGDIAEEEWGQRVKEKRIHDAMYRLREALKELRADEIAALVKAEGTGYKLLSA